MKASHLELGSRRWRTCRLRCELPCKPPTCSCVLRPESCLRGRSARAGELRGVYLNITCYMQVFPSTSHLMMFSTHLAFSEFVITTSVDQQHKINTEKEEHQDQADRVLKQAATEFKIFSRIHLQYCCPEEQAHVAKVTDLSWMSSLFAGTTKPENDVKWSHRQCWCVSLYSGPG